MRRVQCFNPKGGMSPAWEVDLGRRYVVRWWLAGPMRPHLSTRYTVLNGGALGFAFQVMRVHRATRTEAP